MVTNLLMSLSVQCTYSLFGNIHKEYTVLCSESVLLSLSINCTVFRKSTLVTRFILYFSSESALFTVHTHCSEVVLRPRVLPAEPGVPSVNKCTLYFLFRKCTAVIKCTLYSLFRKCGTATSTLCRTWDLVVTKCTLYCGH